MHVYSSPCLRLGGITGSDVCSSLPVIPFTLSHWFHIVIWHIVIFKYDYSHLKYITSSSGSLYIQSWTAACSASETTMLANVSWAAKGRIISRIHLDLFSFNTSTAVYSVIKVMELLDVNRLVSLMQKTSHISNILRLISGLMSVIFCFHRILQWLREKYL